MAPVHRIICERCGHVIRGELYYVPMKAGVHAMVCAECMNMLGSIYRGGHERGLPGQLSLFPVLEEWAGPTHG